MSAASDWPFLMIGFRLFAFHSIVIMPLARAVENKISDYSTSPGGFNEKRGPLKMRLKLLIKAR